jgi:hypothetical protein
LDLSLTYGLTPKGPSPFFSKSTPNLPFLAQEVQMNFFSLFFTFNYRRSLVHAP